MPDVILEGVVEGVLVDVHIRVVTRVAPYRLPRVEDARVVGVVEGWCGRHTEVLLIIGARVNGCSILVKIDSVVEQVVGFVGHMFPARVEAPYLVVRVHRGARTVLGFIYVRLR
jgi:hypothetical protein